jgi:hypothetical protein
MNDDNNKDLLTRLEEENRILSDMVDRAYEMNRTLMRELAHLRNVVDELKNEQNNKS